jgi:hypothetical protein
MKQIFISFLLACSLFLGFFEPTAGASTIEYALMSATPYNSEIALARERLQKFLYKADAKKRAILMQTPMVAVLAAVVPASETGPLLHRIARGEFGIGQGGRPADQASRPVQFLLLFDSRTGQMNSDDGVLVLDPPQRGKTGLFGGVSALYIGAGW